MEHLRTLKKSGRPESSEQAFKKREAYNRLVQLRADLIQELKEATWKLASGKGVPCNHYAEPLFEYVAGLEPYLDPGALDSLPLPEEASDFDRDYVSRVIWRSADGEPRQEPETHLGSPSARLSTRRPEQ